jgi:hypothetical protein
MPVSERDARKLFVTTFLSKNGIGKIDGGDGSLVQLAEVQLVHQGNTGFKLIAEWCPAPADHEDLNAPAEWFPFPAKFAHLPVEYRRSPQCPASP